VYIKQIRSKKTENGGSTALYYILCVYDNKKRVWAEHFITSDMAKTLVEDCRVSLKEIYTNK
jgi:hypothetical protein